MKKFIIFVILFIFITLIAVIGSLLVASDNQVEEIEDILVSQSNLDMDYSCYGYTIDNPRIVVNPYRNANLSALIMFETDNEEKIKVYLNKRDDSRYLLYEENDASKEHYLDIYGMYANYENKVTLVVGDRKFEYTITTTLDIDFPVVDVEINEDEIYFLNFNNSLLGINSEHEVVYYFDGFIDKVIQLENGHLLVSDNRFNNDGSLVGFSEIDMVGRVYNNYIIENGYNGLACELENGNYLLLSDNILQIDRQNGTVLKEFIIDKEDKWLYLEYKDDNNEVILYGEKNILYYDFDSLELKDTVDNNEYLVDDKIQILLGNYYKQFKQNRFGKNKETTVDKNGFNLFFYKKIDEEYRNYNIEFTREFDRLVINKKGVDEEVYLILDKFGGRRVYKIDGNMFYVNNTNLDGKYSIYVKIKEDIYKTNYYVQF